MYNGLALLRDEESGTFWDHITGEALHGPLAGTRLDIWPIALTTVEAALAEYESVTLQRSDHRSLKKWLLEAGSGRKQSLAHGPGRLPPFFRNTMGQVDDRLPEMTQGLGIFEGQRGVFYPMDRIPPGGLEDLWQGRRILLRKGALDRIPRAIYADDPNSRPMQLLMRWYGFCLSFSEVSIYGEEEEDNGGILS